MSWHFSRALVAAFSEDYSADSEPCAPSNGTPTHGTFWSPDKTTEASTPSRSGMTYRPLTDAHGEAVLKWCLEDSLARTFQPQEKAQASPASVPDSGSTWRESSVKYCPSSSSWKTHRCLWDEALPSSSLTLPRWGMTLDGVLWERTTPEHLTSGIEYGSLPTPTAIMSDRSSVQTQAKYVQRTGRQDNLKAWVGRQQWPTPCASEARQGLQIRREGKKGTQESLSTAVRTWPTPTASMMTEADMEQARYAGNKGGNRPSYQEAKQFATPTARDWKSGKASQTTMEKNSRPLSEQIGGQLNPMWVEWLMGWPLGWTDCAASATDKFRQWCQSHGLTFPITESTK